MTDALHRRPARGEHAELYEHPVRLVAHASVGGEASPWYDADPLMPIWCPWCGGYVEKARTWRPRDGAMLRPAGSSVAVRIRISGVECQPCGHTVDSIVMAVSGRCRHGRLHALPCRDCVAEHARPTAASMYAAAEPDGT
jgi:hypothetical protein